MGLKGLNNTPRPRPKDDDDVEPELRAFVAALQEVLLADLGPKAEVEAKTDGREAA